MTDTSRVTAHSRETELLLSLGVKEPAEALRTMKTVRTGLSQGEARTRLRTYGLNEVAREKPSPWWVQLAHAFANPFVIILIVLSGASYMTDVVLAPQGEQTYIKVIILGIMIFLSAFMRFWQEFRSERAAEKLQALVQNKVRVVRGSRAIAASASDECIEIPVSEVVPGDIVQLSAGDMIPADMRLIESRDLFVSQSSLTGESMPIEKFAVPIRPDEKKEFDADKKVHSPIEINTLVFMGTTVVSGSGIAVVLTTGNKTNFGSMATDITGRRAMTSFDEGVSKVSWMLLYFVSIMTLIVFGINGFTKGDWFQAFLFATAVAVGLLPEMLPLVVTANLSKGVMSMSRRKVIVKRLNAVQNFGAMDILCTDKTGTITENRVVLMKHLDPDGKDSDRVFRLTYLNSFFQTGLKNLLDKAVLESKDAEKVMIDQHHYKKVDEIPFDFARRRMSVVVDGEKEGRLLICKGAVEEILNLCVASEHAGDIRPISDVVRANMCRLTNNLNSDGLRVVAVAYKKVSSSHHLYAPQDEKDLILAGYVGFLDPPKASAKDSIKKLEQYGVGIKIITGDNEIVTERVCRDVQLPIEGILTGDQMATLSDEDLIARAEKTTLFVKVDPAQKARIIAALRKGGHTVGFMGDGINDAPAMREADVSVSVDTAVDIAKESADIILLEHDLHVLARGIIEGRTVFGNIMKYIKMTASSNFGNVFSILPASAFLPFLPMLPLQLLVQNMLYDFSQLTIPLDRMDEDFLRKPRKWEAGGIVRFMVFVGPLSSLFDITTFCMMWFVFQANTPAAQSLFQSGWFVEGLLSQTIIIHLIRTRKIPFIQSTASPIVIASTGAIILMGILIPFTPFGHGIGLMGLPLLYFPLLIVILLGYIVLVQSVKTWYIRRFATWL